MPVSGLELLEVGLVTAYPMWHSCPQALVLQGSKAASLGHGSSWAVQAGRVPTDSSIQLGSTSVGCHSSVMDCWLPLRKVLPSKGFTSYLQYFPSAREDWSQDSPFP